MNNIVKFLCRYYGYKFEFRCYPPINYLETHINYKDINFSVYNHTNNSYLLFIFNNHINVDSKIILTLKQLLYKICNYMATRLYERQ